MVLGARHEEIALAAAGAATAAVGLLAAALLRGGWRALASIAGAASGALQALLRRTRIATARFRMWREQRARRANQKDRPDDIAER